jgi:hypothetical protein
MLTNLLNLKEYLLAIKPVGGGDFAIQTKAKKLF